jgi:hypothetical protein
MVPNEVFKGCGTGISRTDELPVNFELFVHQDRIGAGRHEDVCEASIQIRGWILPLFGNKGELLTLKISDGGTIRFFFQDMVGSIISYSGIS